MSNVKLTTAFWRAQIASLAATVVDFGTLVFTVEVLHRWYVGGTAAGAFFGAVTNFTIGRYWSFSASDRPVGGQVFRYALVAAGSLLLNSGGVYLITEYLGRPYWVSKIITGFLVGITFNFFLHRRFVFRKPSYEKINPTAS